MKTGLTATVLVCVGAAGIAIGALAIDAGGDGDSDDADSTEESEGTPESTAGGGYGSNDEGGDGSAQDATVTISDFNFSQVTVDPGASVAVENQDDFPHTVTAQDGAFDSGEIGAGASGTFQAPSSPGTYEITCNIHPQMSGTITVE